MANEAIGLIEPVLQFEDEAGVPYAAGSIGFYDVGTLNLENVYSDPALTTPLPNPVPLNAAGRSSTSTIGVATPVYLQQKTYDYLLKDANGVTIYGPITVSGSQWPGQIQGQAILSPAANANGYTNRFTTTINKATSGVHALFAGTRFDTTVIGAGASVLTEAATVYIEGAPTTGTNQYALHVASGTSRFDGPVLVQGAAILGDASINHFRLTATTATPVTPTDVLAVTLVYWTPYTGNLIALYDGVSVWNQRMSAELTLVVPSTTATMYDVFIYDNAGVPTIEALAWTSDTVRATALTTLSGILVKSTDPTRRYVGSFRTTAVSGQTEDSAAKRYLWNYYNRVQRSLRWLETTAQWTYNVDTFRQARATATNQLDVVVGWAEVMLHADVRVTWGCSATVSAAVSIGEDSTTTPMPTAVWMRTGDFNGGGLTTGFLFSGIAMVDAYPAVGRHFYPWLERATANTATFWGTTNSQAGMSGSYWG